MNHIFLDNNSTTQIDKEVLKHINNTINTNFGNPSSNNLFGKIAYDYVEKSRFKISKLVKCSPNDLFFTSGSTESNNLAIKGFSLQNKKKGNHIITFKTEHKSVLDVCDYLSKEQGFKISYLDVNNDGTIDLNVLKKTFTSETILCIVMHANNEIGIINPINEINNICKKNNVFLFVDATQSVGKIPVDIELMDIDLMSFSSHKLYGPQGIGCLYIKNGIKNRVLKGQIVGGGQESNYRSGTLNVLGIIGFGKAAEIANMKLPTEQLKILKLRNKIYNTFVENFDNFKLNGSIDNRLPGNLNFSLKGIDNTWIMTQLFNKVSISNGSACNSSAMELSHVLKAINSDDEISKSSLRLCVGRFNTEQEIDYFINLIFDLVNQYKKIKD